MEVANARLEAREAALVEARAELQASRVQADDAKEAAALELKRTAAQAASRLDGARAQIGERDVELLRLKAQISDAEEELGEWRLGNLRVSNWAVWTKAFDERRGR